MKKVLIALMLVMPFFVNAQEENNLVSKDSTSKDSLPTLDLVGSIETNLKKEQIKSIGGIAFGISQEKALPILRKDVYKRQCLYHPCSSKSRPSTILTPSGKSATHIR